VRDPRGLSSRDPRLSGEDASRAPHGFPERLPCRGPPGGAPEFPAAGCCGPFDGQGPSGVLVTPNNQLRATDAHGTVKVFDLTDAQPPFNLARIATIFIGAQCRADELAFDPSDHLIIVGNPAENPPFAALISSDPPYNLLGQIPFPGAGGLEASVWDPELQRFLTNVPGTGNSGVVAVIQSKDHAGPDHLRNAGLRQQRPRACAVSRPAGGLQRRAAAPHSERAEWRRAQHHSPNPWRR
jgi:hypothetical protein